MDPTIAQARLLDAVSKGDVDAVRACLGSHPDPNVKDASGATPIILAAASDKLDIVKLLLDKGADASAKDKQGRDALMLAVRRGSVKMVLALLKAGADPDAAEKGSDTALIEAARQKNPDIARALLDAKAQVDRPGLYDRTALMTAVSHGSGKVIALLSERGASFGGIDSEGKDVLMHAARCGRLAIYDWVLSKGAARPADPKREIMLRECLGEGLVKAVEAGSLEDAKGLLDHGAVLEPVAASMPALAAAAAHGDTNIMRLLVDRGAVIESTGKGRTALMMASECGRDAAVGFLLDRGARIDAASPTDRCTALMLAATAGHAAIVQSLLKRGADAEATDANGATVFRHALGQIDILKLLLRQRGMEFPDEYSATLPTIKEGTGARPLRILIIDDEPGITVLLQFVLQKAGGLAEGSCDARQALARAAEFRPDIVMSDLLMPHMSGYEICSIFRRMDWAGRTLFILMSGKFQFRCEDRLACCAFGVDAMIGKPFDPRELKWLIALLLACNSAPSRRS